MTKKILIFSPGGLDMMVDSFAHGFREHGHEVEIFFTERPTPSLYLLKLMSRTPWTHLALAYDAKYREENGAPYEAKIRSYKPDLIFMYNFYSLSARLLRKIACEYKIPTAYLVMADPLVSSEHQAYYIDHLVECSDLFFINPTAMPSLRLISRANIHYLPLAADERYYKPLNLEKDLDFILIGQFASISVATITKAYIMDRLCAAGFRVSAAGMGLEKIVRLPQFPHLKKLEIVTSSSLPIEEVNRLYNRAKIVLAPEHPRDKDSPSPRAFEAAMAGSFALADYQSEAEPLFRGTLPTFRSVDEMVEQAHYYLKHEAEREDLARKAHAIIAREHTYVRRAGEMLEKVFGAAH